MVKIIGILFVLIFTACSCSGRAEARPRQNVSARGQFSFQIEANGAVLPTYDHRGHTYIEGRWGETYGIRVFNHTGRRAEAVVTVDGRDVISGRVGDYRKQRGYVVPPYGSVWIDGFRRNLRQVAAFRFTELSGSYAARMGPATDVGVIGVAIFKERPRPPRPKTRPPIAYDGHSPGLGRGYGAAESKRDTFGAKSAPSAAYEAEDRAASRGSYSRQNMGTEYGESTYSPASNTWFKRQHKRHPSAVLTLRYDDYEGLEARGVFCAKPNPFPDSPRFAPAPPPRH